MSTIEQSAVVGYETPKTERKGSILADWLSSTDHKIIGHMYLITSFFFFLCAGVMALIMRIQLLGPDNHIVSDQQYNELFTMHGTLMLLLFATPLFIGFSNELIPLQIGAPDVAFPRLNLLSYYLFTFGERELLSARDQRRGAGAQQLDRLMEIVGHGRRRYSVDTRSPLASSALFSACQPSDAHLTRAGNSETPDKTASLPSARGSASAPGPSVNMRWTLSNRSMASSLVLPFSASVMSEVEALEMAHPAPSKEMSSMRLPSSLTYSVSWSPHRGFTASMVRVALSRTRKFRGCLE